MGPTWVLRPQMGPMLAPWTLLSGKAFQLRNYTNVFILFKFHTSPTDKKSGLFQAMVHLVPDSKAMHFTDTFMHNWCIDELSGFNVLTTIPYAILI